MSDVLELLFRAIVQDDGGLARIDQAVKRIGQESGLTGAALTNLEKSVRASFERMNAAGLTFEQALKRIAQSGDTIGRGVSGAAKQMQKDLEDAANAAKNLAEQQKKLQQAGSSLQSGVQSSLSNPFQAIANGAIKAAAEIGPLGVALSGIGIVATLGGKALFDLVNRQGELAQQTVNLANQIGITAGEMKKLQVMGDLVGVSFQSMQIAARNLALAVEEPTGAGKRAAKALQDLGIATQTASGSMRQEGQIFEESITALAGVEDQTKRTEEATSLFGSRSSAAIRRVINDYQELDATARSLGYGDTTQLTEALAKGEEKINAMTAAWDLFKAKLAERVEPITIKVVGDLTKIILSKDARIEAGTAAGRDAAALQDQKDYDSKSALSKFVGLLNGDGLRLTAAQLAGANPEASWNPGSIDPMRGLSDPSGRDDLAAGAATTKRSMDAFNASLDGMTIKIRENTTKIEDDRAEQARGGLGRAEADRLAAEITHLEAQNRALKASEEAAKETDNYFRKLHEDVTKTEQYPALNKYKPEGLAALYAERDYGLDRARNAGDKADVTTRANQGYQSLIKEWIGKIQDETVKQIREATKKSGSEMEKEFDAYNKEVARTADADALRAISYQEGLDKIQASSQKAALSLQQKAVLGYSKLQSGGETQGTAQLEGNFQIASVQSDEAQHARELTQLISQLQQGDDQSEKVQDRIKDLRLELESSAKKAEEEIANLRLDTELKIAEMRKKELAEYKQQGEDIFNALRQPNHELGLQQYFRGQANDLARGIFGNATAPILRNIGQTLGGATQGLPPEVQTLFKGTVLDSARAKSPQIEATDKNTTALIDLTDALTGQHSAGGHGITPAPGSVVANAAAIAPGTPAPLVPGSIYTDTDSAITLAGTPGYHTASPGGASAPAAGLGPLGKLLTGSSSSAASSTLLGQLLKGATSGIGNWGEIFHGDTTTTDKDGNTTTTAVSPGQQAGAIIGTTAAAGAGIYESVNQFEKGGTAGILGGTGAALGTAALLDPEPTSKAALTIGATFASLFASLFDQGLLTREAAIANQTAYNTYVPPPTLDRNLSASGGFEQVNNKYGLPSATTYTSVAIEQPFKYQSPIKDPTGYLQNWETAPGQVIEPYAAPAAQPNWITSQAPAAMTFVQNVSTMDAQSFIDNRNKIATALQVAVVEGHPAGSALQRAVLGGG